MIAYIKGILSEVGENHIILDNHGIGYLIYMAGSDLASLAGIERELRIHTYTYVREDILDLYGFLSQDGLNIFKLLLGVSGIGPKGALGVLSALTADELRFAVISNDAKTIAKAPGIGLKTAQKLIIELKDKLKLEDSFELKQTHMEDGSESLDHIRREAMEALKALGYSSADALRAVSKAEWKEGMTVEELLKASLKNINL